MNDLYKLVKDSWVVSQTFRGDTRLNGIFPDDDSAQEYVRLQENEGYSGFDIDTIADYLESNFSTQARTGYGKPAKDDENGWHFITWLTNRAEPSRTDTPWLDFLLNRLPN